MFTILFSWLPGEVGVTVSERERERLSVLFHLLFGIA